MRTYPAALAAITGVVGIAAAALAIIPPSPGEPPERVSRHGYDALSYDLSLEFDPTAKTFTGRVVMTALMLEPRNELIMDASALTLTIDTVGGTPVLRHSGDTLALNAGPPGEPGQPGQSGQPGRMLSPGDTVEVTVRFSGISTYDGRYDGGGVLFTSDELGDRIATLSQPAFARLWWPCNDTPGDKARVSTTITVPEPMKAVSNGRLIASTSAGGMTRSSWKSEYPIATYLVSVAAAVYDVRYDTMLIDAPAPPATEAGVAAGNVATVQQKGPMGVVLGLYTYVYPADAERSRKDFSSTKKILSVFGELFGPYPFALDKYAVAEVDGFLTMENQSAVSFQRGLITGDGRSESVLVHEIAHQWWGNLIGPAGWGDLWLSEGAATYAEALWHERTAGPDRYASIIAGLMDRPDNSYAGSVAGRDSDPFEELFTPRTYDKGAVVLHMLRREVGDAAFFRGIRAYLDDPALRYGTARTGDFVQHIEKAASADLGWFFDQWVYAHSGPADRPLIEYGYRHDAATGKLVVDIAQVQPGELVYRLPLEIVAVSAGTVQKFTAIDSARSQTISLSMSVPPDTLILDPERSLFISARRR